MTSAPGRSLTLGLRESRTNSGTSASSVKWGARYHNVPFRPDSPDYVKHETELFRDATDMGELYLYRIRQPEFGKRLRA
jgi:hypothetical protein